MTTIGLFLNQFISSSEKFSKLFNNSSILFATYEIVLLSGKLCKSEFFIERKISLTNMLKCAGPNRGPCSTPDSNNISKELRCYLF